MTNKFTIDNKYAVFRYTILNYTNNRIQISLCFTYGVIVVFSFTIDIVGPTCHVNHDYNPEEISKAR